jgi:RNA polymerase-binding transcription factor DksA
MATKLGQQRLNELREALVAKRRQLEAEVGRSVLYEKGLDDDATKDLGDQANTAYTREFLFEPGGLRRGARRTKHALDRLATERFCVRVDVTEEFPFLVTKMSPYYDRRTNYMMKTRTT